MGIRWFLFRVKYELLKKTPYFDFKNQTVLKKCSTLNSLALPRQNILNSNFKTKDDSVDLADDALKGKIRAFSSEQLDYSTSMGRINWHYNPIEKKESPSNIAWNDLSDFGGYGDIKLIWEASRFPQVYAFINAYSLTGDEKYARGCIEQICDWCENNVYPNGVNYKCGQEISFRLFSWFIALDYFKSSIRDEEKKIILNNIEISLLRIDLNIDFAVKSVKNNHSISEAAGLFVGGLLFPELSESQSFISKGHRYLKQEVGYQVYGDGSYIQHSFIYQRLALDVLSFVIHISRVCQFELASEIIQSHKKMIVFLNSFVQKNGFLPNYGANDGANLFPISSSAHYRDFRESLNFASAVNMNVFLFPCQQILANLFGYAELPLKEIGKKNSFDDGGYYILRNDNFFVFTRCHSFLDRPGHSDMLHVDIWKNGENIFCDSGTYSYNGDKKIMKNLKGVHGHNTLSINKDDQMTQAGQFGWSDWTKSKVLNSSEKYFEGVHYGYFKRYGVKHRRSIELSDNKITIKDSLEGQYMNALVDVSWITPLKVKEVDTHNFEVGEATLYSNFPGNLGEVKVSLFYNSVESANKISFKTNELDGKEIITIIKFQENE